MVAGFLFAFFGHKFFKITLFLAGFYVCGESWYITYCLPKGPQILFLIVHRSADTLNYSHAYLDRPPQPRAFQGLWTGLGMGLHWRFRRSRLRRWLSLPMLLAPWICSDWWSSRLLLGNLCALLVQLRRHFQWYRPNNLHHRLYHRGHCPNILFRTTRRHPRNRHCWIGFVHCRIG